MNNSYVEINKLTKHFGAAHARGNGEGKPVLDQLSLRVKEGELVTLLGPSGCGKSTLLRCIAGLTDFDQGEVRLDGRDLAWLQPKVRQVGMVFQSYALFPNMTVYDNVAFGLVMQRLPRQDIRTYCADAGADRYDGQKRSLPASALRRTAAARCSCPLACRATEADADG